jgi:hypothetical protein
LLSCFLECVLAGDVNSATFQRSRIARLLDRKPALVERLRKSRSECHTRRGLKSAPGRCNACSFLALRFRSRFSTRGTSSKLAQIAVVLTKVLIGPCNKNSPNSPWQKYLKIAGGDRERGNVTMVFSAGQ